MPLIPRMEPADAVAATVRSGRAARSGSVEGLRRPLRPLRSSLSSSLFPPSPSHPEPDRGPSLPIDLHEALAGRSATRAYDARRPNAWLLASVVALALEHDACQWPVDVHGPSPDLLLAAHDVAGLEPGVYSWQDPASVDSFHALAQPPWLRDLQVRYCAAPAMFLLHGSPLRAGADGYGDLLVRMGSLGHALWLSARTHGLDACAFGGPSPEVTASLRTIDPTERHLFTLATGYAAQG